MNERIKGEMNELKDLKMTGVYIIPIFFIPPPPNNNPENDAFEKA